MRMTRIEVLALVAGVVGMTMASAPAMAQQDNCDWYAKTAVRQQQLNEEKKCNFAGLSWHKDLAKHMAWCQSVPPDLWKAEAKKRSEELEACQKK